MPRIEKTVFMDGSPASVMFKCPGCGHSHDLFTQHTKASAQGPRWTFNDDYERPVLNPSINMRYPHYSPARREEARSFFAKHGEYPTLEQLPYDALTICHSFVGCNGAEPGQIIFLGDCTHEHAGKVMDLPEVNPED